MKKLVAMLVVMVIVTSAQAIITPGAYIPFENGDGRTAEIGWYARGGGGANNAWNNVVPSTPEQVNYIGSGSATTWATTGSADGIKGDYMDMTGNGVANTDPYATLSYKFETVDLLSDAKSYTFTWWANTRDAGRNGSDSFIFKQFGTNGPMMKWRSDGRLQTMVNGSWYYSGWHTTDSAGDWVFCALTVDAVNGSVSMYSGYEDSSVVVAGESTGLSLSPVGTLTSGDPTSTPFILTGYTYNASDKYPGMDLDEFRIYASKTDASGALSLEEIEAIRQFDLVPEPATLALMGLGMFVIRRKK